jgi:hypothetical protein
VSRELTLPLPLDHQLPVHESTARFKVVRAGRRWGKTREAFIAANAGHGPGWHDGEPLYPGLLQGWDVVWLGKDYPQARQIWEEGVEPRYRGLSGTDGCVDLNQSERTVKLRGGGTLHIRSAEIKSLQGIRGLGAKLKGVIIDEAAWLDFDYAWKNVLRPMLMDNQGWAIVMSTTNAGLDGGKDPETGNPISPSGFNRLCEQVMAGAVGRTRQDGWEHFYGIASDNPKIQPTEFRALLTEYTPGTLALEQEIYAKLLAGGAGLAFPEWRDDHHIVSFDPPPGWRWIAGMDWGYSDHCWIGFAAAGSSDTLIRHEIYCRKKTPYDVGYMAGERCKRIGHVEYIAAGDDMWRVTDGGPTIAEEFARGLSDATQPHPVALISVGRGAGSRGTGKIMVHEALKYEVGPDGKIPNWACAKLRVHKDCANLIRTLPKLPLDPHNTEDVWDEGTEDHPYDGLRYLLQSRVPRPTKENYESVPVDVHPGWDLAKKRKRPRWQDPAERELEQLYQQSPTSTGVRYGMSQPMEDE